MQTEEIAENDKHVYRFAGFFKWQIEENAENDEHVYRFADFFNWKNLAA